MKIFISIAFIALLLFSWTLFDWQPYLENPELIRDAVRAYPLWAPLAFFIIHTLVEIVFIPGSPFTVAGGLLFGTFLGTLYSLLSALLGAVIIFWILRYTGKEFFIKYLHERFALVRHYNSALVQNGFWHVLLLRLAPFIPANVINLGYGLSQVKFSDYFWATLLGNLPSTFILSWLGTRFLVWKEQTVILVILVLIILGTPASFLYQRYLRSRGQAV